MRYCSSPCLHWAWFAAKCTLGQAKARRRDPMPDVSITCSLSAETACDLPSAPDAVKPPGAYHSKLIGSRFRQVDGLAAGHG